MEIRNKRTLTPEQALNRLMGYCSKAEKCLSDAVSLLRRWGVEPAEHAAVLDCLVRNGYIDEERYARAYVRDKMNYSGWGAGKIAQGLRLKRLPPETIRRAMEQITPDALDGKLEKALQARLPRTKARSRYELKGKLLQFGLSRGFDYEKVSAAVDRLLSDAAEDE